MHWWPFLGCAVRPRGVPYELQLAAAACVDSMLVIDVKRADAFTLKLVCSVQVQLPLRPFFPFQQAYCTIRPASALPRQIIYQLCGLQPPPLLFCFSAGTRVPQLLPSNCGAWAALRAIAVHADLHGGCQLAPHA